MNILLINPLSVEEFSESYGIKVVFLPFNLLCLASYLSQHNHHVEVLDGQLDRIEITKELVSKLDFIGLSIMTAHIKHAYDIIKQIKVIDKSKKKLMKE